MIKTTDNRSHENTSNESPTGISYAEIGERLQAQRVQRNMSLAEAACQLHLPATVLSDLESGRIERLAPLYRRGYIKNYALLIGLDPAPLLAGLKPDEPPQLTEVLPVRSSRFRLDRYMKIATYLIVTTIIVPPLVMIYLHSGANLFERSVPADQTSVVRQDQENSPAQTVIPDPPSAQEEQARHVSASALPLAAIRPVRDSADRPSATSEPAGITPVEPAERPFEVVVRLRDDSWIEIAAADGERLEYDLLRAGQERRYQGEPPFRILLGRASSVDLLIDGQVLEYDGSDRGDVAELTLMVDGNIQR